VDAVDRFGGLKPSRMLLMAQQVAAEHSSSIGLTYEALAAKGLFWAVVRNRLQVTRLPREGETVWMETWPMPTTRTAYPRSTVAYDEKGSELFRTLSLWVLMRFDDRSMVLPDKSDVTVDGILRGNELAVPRSVALKPMGNRLERTVRFTDLDKNGHMNNARYLEWVDDLLPSEFHREHPLADVTLCYMNEAREGQNLRVTWDTDPEGTLLVDIHRPNGEDHDRIFAARIVFENGVL
jgi:acyl-ACP thioesterase